MSLSESERNRNAERYLEELKKRAKKRGRRFLWLSLGFSALMVLGSYFGSKHYKQEIEKTPITAPAEIPNNDLPVFDERSGERFYPKEEPEEDYPIFENNKNRQRYTPRENLERMEEKNREKPKKEPVKGEEENKEEPWKQYMWRKYAHDVPAPYVYRNWANALRMGLPKDKMGIKKT